MSPEETRPILRGILREGRERAGTARRLAEALPAAGGYRWLGLYDVESDRAAAFTAEDRSFLERCAGDLADFWRAGG